VQKSTTPFGTYSLVGARSYLASVSRSFPKSRLFFRLGLMLRKWALEKNKQVDAVIFGLKMRLDPTKNLGDRFVLFTPQYFENQEREFLRENFRDKKIVFVDVGANTGFYSMYVSSLVGEGSRVIAIEPNVEVLPRLEFHLDENKRPGISVSVVPCGVSDVAGILEFSYVPGNWGSGSLVNLDNQIKTRIPCRPLLSVMREFGVDQIDLLKIDIEGGEVRALKPFFDSAPKSLWPRTLIIESDNELDLERLGYKKLKRTNSHNSIYQLLECGRKIGQNPTKV
jgi:FkbM family methyltransferase